MSIEQRLTQLERRLKRTHNLMIAIVLAAFAVVCVAQQKAGLPEVIEAKSFAVVDAKGNRRIFIGMSEGNPRLSMSAADNKSRLQLLVTAEGLPVIALLNSGEKALVTLSLTAKENGLIAIRDSERKVLFYAPEQ